MMRSKIEFWENRFYEPADYDANLMTRKRTTRHEFGVLLRCLGVIRGYGRWLGLVIAINMGVATLWLLVPWLERILLDEVIPRESWSGFWLIFAIYLVVETQRHITSHINSVLMCFLNGRMGLWLQVKYYRHLQRIPLTYIERKGIGDHMYRMHSDTIGILGMVTYFIPGLINQIYTLGIYLLFVSFLDWRLTLVVAAYEIFYVVTAQWIGTWQRKIEFYVRGTKAAADARMQEGLHGVATVKVYGRRKAEVGSFMHKVALQMRVEVWGQLLWLVRSLLLRGSGLFPYMKDFFIMNYLYYKVITGDITYGLIFPVLAYLNNIGSPVEALTNMWQNIRFRLVWAERVFQIWDVKPAVKNVEHPRAVERLSGQLDICNVNFEYENGVQVLFDVNFRVKPAQFVAIVGASGSGKSTLLNLLIRLYDPSGGQICADGVDIRQYDYNAYQNSLGIVLQETFLSKESLRWNMLLGNYLATEEEMLGALERCRLSEWFGKLPDGLDSLLNEGTRVSVGEKQRLGVARSLLRRSNLLLLDEPTSSLDLDTEAEVMDVIHDVRKGKTTVMVTHRLNTIRDADMILAMDNGRIVEVGTHDELMSRQGHYHNLVSMFHATRQVVAAAESPASSAPAAG